MQLICFVYLHVGRAQIGPVLCEFLKHSSSQHVNRLYFSSVDSLIIGIHPNAIPLKRHGLRWMR